MKNFLKMMSFAYQTFSELSHAIKVYSPNIYQGKTTPNNNACKSNCKEQGEWVFFKLLFNNFMNQIFLKKLMWFYRG